MAITTESGLIAGYASAQRCVFFKEATSAEASGTWVSYWKTAGVPGAGATPAAYTAGSGYVPTDATAGSFPFTNGNTTYLSRLALLRYARPVVLYRRLWHCSGMSMNTASTQTITTPGTADADGTGVEIFGEVYSAGGAGGGGTWSISYTDASGNTKTATYTHPTNAESVGQMLPFAWQSGGAGCRGVISATLTASGTAGDFGITLVKRVAEVHGYLTTAGGSVMGPFDLGLPVIADDSCLALMAFAGTTVTGNLWGSFDLIQG